MSKHVRDITGVSFGRLTAVSIHGMSIEGAATWLCVCTCGAQKVIRGTTLRAGKARSCGCMRLDSIQRVTVKHGMAGTPEYTAYSSAKDRCNNKNNKRFSGYGGRGIEFRFESFEHWFEVLGPRPSPDMSVDRLDNDGHYEPGNVAWSDRSQQQRNTRRTRRHRLLTHNGKTMSVREWSEFTGLIPQIISTRLRNGWSVADALSPRRYAKTRAHA